MLASAVATGLATKATDLINEHGHNIGLSARRGNQFQGMTWSATLLTFIAAVIWTDVFKRKLQHTVIWHIDRNGSGRRGRSNVRDRSYEEEEYVEKSARGAG